LTFKTLSLGYCITAGDVWNKTFKSPIEKHLKTLCTMKPFAAISFSQTETIEMMKNDISSLGASSVRMCMENIDFISSHFSNSEVDLKSEIK
jgi:hypothetical protein